jgi:hypothetical protein
LYYVAGMLSLRSSSQRTDRPSGIGPVAALLGLFALASFIFTALLLRNTVSLSAGTLLLGGGLEQLGPLAFLINGVFAAALAVGLWMRWKWSRLGTMLYCAAGVLLAVPAMSSAVVDLRLAAVAREGLQIMIRVAMVYYLSQEPVKEWFLAG